MPKTSPLFNTVGGFPPKRNKFDLSHERKMSIEMANIVPIMCTEVLPGDSFRVSTEMLMRFAPLMAPVMHRMNVKFDWYFTPNRLLWNEWEDFITGGKDGTSNPVPPHIIIDDDVKANFATGKLPDYFGVQVVSPTDPITNPISISCLPFRAYQLIYNEYYRDQNLQSPMTIDLGSGPMDTAQSLALTTMRKSAWEKDAYTSALPWAQRGPEVLMPLDLTSNVTYKNPPTFHDAAGNPVSSNDGLRMLSTSPTPGQVGYGPPAPAGANMTGGTLRNIDSVTFPEAAITATELRKSQRLQVFLEKMATGGSRYIEVIKRIFGVRSSDARLQRPEYLGGASKPVVISEVLTTFQDAAGAGNPTASMAGHGVSSGGAFGFKKSFEEHGFIIGVMRVLPRTGYYQGIPKMFRRFDKFEYAWPDFMHIGEQPVEISELWYNAHGAAEDHKATFGYQSRGYEYKYMASSVHGRMRNQLLYWHMARQFSSKPVLNESFIVADPTKRIFNVEDQAVESLYVSLYNHVSAIRPLPYYSSTTPI